MANPKTFAEAAGGLRTNYLGWQFSKELCEFRAFDYVGQQHRPLFQIVHPLLPYMSKDGFGRFNYVADALWSITERERHGLQRVVMTMKDEGYIAVFFSHVSGRMRVRYSNEVVGKYRVSFRIWFDNPHLTHVATKSNHWFTGSWPFPYSEAMRQKHKELYKEAYG